MSEEVKESGNKLINWIFYIALIAVFLIFSFILFDEADNDLKREAKEAKRRCEWEIPRKQTCKITAEPIPLPRKYESSN